MQLITSFLFLMGVKFNYCITVGDTTAVYEALYWWWHFCSYVCSCCNGWQRWWNWDLCLWIRKWMPPVVTAQKAVRAFTIITQYYDAHGLHEKTVNVFCIRSTFKGDYQAPRRKKDNSFFKQRKILLDVLNVSVQCPYEVELKLSII